MKKVALITGITGQDGSYLAELLLEKDYVVHGIIRRASGFNTQRIDHIINHPRLHLHHGDITDSANINRLLSQIKPDEVYNLAAQSHVQVSFEMPEYTAQVDAVGTLRMLDGVNNHCPKARFYQASTSELYGKVAEIPQNEKTPFHPMSPYGVAMIYSYWLVRNYREAYGLFASNGILFNHESERRGKTFSTRKITVGLSEIKYGLRDVLYMGNINAIRDWGYAPEYVDAMWRILQHDSPDDFVIATGSKCSVKEFIEMAGLCAGFEIEWEGEGINEIGIDVNSGKTIIEIDPRYYRPAEVDLLIGDPEKAENLLGWKAKTNIVELVEIMMKHDMWEAKEKAERGA